MLFYPEDLIEEVRVSNDIVNVVSEYIKLEKKGANYFGLCPFHREKTPSLSVSPTKQIYNCFGCGKGGNVIQFIMNIENLDFLESVRLLAERSHIPLPEEQSKEAIRKAGLIKSITKINTQAARFFYDKLNASGSEKVRKYLGDRGLTAKTITKFGIGYSSEDWDELYRYLVHVGFDAQSILQSGLIIKDKKGGYFDRFRGRIIFPIFDIRGNVIGFGGRIIDSSGPKYMNSPETIVYNKRKNLYAMNFARTSGEKSVIVVEGYMDSISLHQCGINNAVASLGTSLTESQGRLLKKYFEEIIISYDADTAGQAATIRGLDILNGIGCNVKVLVLPDGKDPDEFVKKNGELSYRKLADNALPLVEYKIKVLKNQINIDSTDGKIEFLNKCSDLLSKIDNRVERDMYISKLAKEYNIPKESLATEVYKRAKPGQKIRRTFEIKKNSVNSNQEGIYKEEKLAYYERILLSFLCIDNSAYFVINDRLGEYDFTSENADVANFAFERLRSKEGIIPAELLNFVNEDLAGKFGGVMQEDCNCDDIKKGVVDILNKIELYKLDIRRLEILDSLQAQQDEGVVEKLNHELKSIMIKILLLKKGGNRNED